MASSSLALKSVRRGRRSGLKLSKRSVDERPRTPISAVRHQLLESGKGCKERLCRFLRISFFCPILAKLCQSLLPGTHAPASEVQYREKCTATATRPYFWNISFTRADAILRLPSSPAPDRLAALRQLQAHWLGSFVEARRGGRTAVDPERMCGCNELAAGANPVLPLLSIYRLPAMAALARTCSLVLLVGADTDCLTMRDDILQLGRVSILKFEVAPNTNTHEAAARFPRYKYG